MSQVILKQKKVYKHLKICDREDLSFNLNKIILIKYKA